VSSPGPTARIIDRGYRRYDGPRLGRRGANVALWRASVQRSLGLRRRFRYKVVPIATVLMAYVPAAVFVGVVALIPGEVVGAIVPRYGAYYGYVSAVILLFAAVAGPDALCSDRRSGMLGLYLAAPFTRASYLAAKAAALASTLTLVTVGPPLLLLVGYTLADGGPAWPLEGTLLLGRVVAAGACVAAWYTALGMAAASLTDRRAFAAAGVVLAALVSTATVGVLVGPAGLPAALRLADLLVLPFDLVQRIYGEPVEIDGVPGPLVVVAYLAWLGAAASLVAWRYRRLVVTR
jgi:ABC-2 type transport system permease protein